MKSFEPTPARLARARRDGDHPLSRDAVAVATFCGASLGLLAVFPLARAVLLSGLRELPNTASSTRIAIVLCIAVAVTAAGGLVAAVFATLVQTRGLSVRPLSFRLSVTPAFGAAAARGALAAIAALAVLPFTVRPSPAAIVRSIEAVLAIGLLGAAIDVLLVHKSWRRRLRMTFDELRRDAREHDGDPQTRGRRRRLHRMMVRGALRNVRRATFVVVNPTHIAIALRYVADEMPVPVILVRAADEGALRVRKLAAEARIPLIEDPPLARQLYAHEALGPIPPEVYLAVAQIVAALHRES